MKTAVQWEYDFVKWSGKYDWKKSSRCKSNMGLNAILFETEEAFNEVLKT